MKIPETPPKLKEVLPLLSGLSGEFELVGLGNHRKESFFYQANEAYFHWDDLKYREMPPGLSREQVWGILKVGRNLNSRRIYLDSGLVFGYVQTPFIERKLHDLDRRSGAWLGSSEPRVDASGKKFLINALMEEAIASSQLEGATTTRKVAKEMLRKNRSPSNHSERMIVNNYQTMSFIKQEAEREKRITPEFLLEVHKRITEKTLENPADEGRFRQTDDVRVMDNFDLSQELYCPSDHRRIRPLLEALCAYLNDDSIGPYLNPIVRAIFLHFAIGYIHPFNDGNGRTARALFYWYMLSRGYWLYEYLAVSRIFKRTSSQYARAYLHSETDGNDFTYFVLFHLGVLEKSFLEFEEYLKNKQQERQQIIQRIRSNPNLSLRQTDILFEASSTPDVWYSIDEIKNRYQVTYQTARSDLLELERLGYFDKEKRGRKFLFCLKRKG